LRASVAARSFAAIRFLRFNHHILLKTQHKLSRHLCDSAAVLAAGGGSPMRAHASSARSSARLLPLCGHALHFFLARSLLTTPRERPSWRMIGERATNSIRRSVPSASRNNRLGLPNSGVRYRAYSCCESLGERGAQNRNKLA